MSCNPIDVFEWKHYSDRKKINFKRPTFIVGLFFVERCFHLIKKNKIVLDEVESCEFTYDNVKCSSIERGKYYICAYDKLNVGANDALTHSLKVLLLLLCIGSFSYSGIGFANDDFILGFDNQWYTAQNYIIEGIQ